MIGLLIVIVLMIIMLVYESISPFDEDNSIADWKMKRLKEGKPY